MTATSKLPPDILDGESLLAREVEEAVAVPLEPSGGCALTVASGVVAVAEPGLVPSNSGLASGRSVLVGLEAALLSLILS